MTTQKEQLSDVVDHFKQAMLVTSDPSGAPRARPMALAATENDGETLWFVTGRDAAKNDEIERDHRAAVTMQSSTRFVSLTGTARQVDDRGKLDALWNAHFGAWFENGQDDATLIRFDATRAEYWDGSGVMGLGYVFKMLKAAITDDTPQVGDDQHAKVRFEH